MTNGTPIKVPIESFILMQDEPNGGYQLVFMDPQGKRHTAKIKKSLIENALRILDGRAKAISRSTGGLVSAQPYQIVFFHTVNAPENAVPELRIKVRFKDFVKNEGESVTTGASTSLTKALLPEEIRGELSYDLQTKQKFLMDFGQGPIPVAVFAFITEPGGEAEALLVDAHAIEDLMSKKPGGKISIQRYKVPRDLVRVVVDSDTAHADFQKARENYERLKKLGESIFPAALQTGQPTEIPTGLSFQAIRDLLRKSMHRWNAQEQESDTVAEYKNREEECVTSDILMYMEPI